MVGDCSPNACSYKHNVWWGVGGYDEFVEGQHGEDHTFLQKAIAKFSCMQRDSVVSEIDYVYNSTKARLYGGSQALRQNAYDHVATIASKQLQELDLEGKEYWIEPDYDAYNKVVDEIKEFIANPPKCCGRK
jgi:hypothetical protein